MSNKIEFDYHDGEEYVYIDGVPTHKLTVAEGYIDRWVSNRELGLLDAQQRLNEAQEDATRAQESLARTREILAALNSRPRPISELEDALLGKSWVANVPNIPTFITDDGRRVVIDQWSLEKRPDEVADSFRVHLCVERDA